MVLGGAVELAAPGRPAEVLVDAPTAARIAPQPCPGPRRGPAGFQQAKQQKPDQAHPGIAPARGGGCASAGLTEGAALGAHARAPGCADCGWEEESGRGRPGRGGGQGREEEKEGGETRRDGKKGEMEKRTCGERERRMERRCGERERKVERKDFKFSPRNGGMFPCRTQLRRKGARQQKAAVVPGGARGSGPASPAHSAPASAVGQPLLRRAPCAPPPASERSPPRPQTNYASENYRARPKGSRPRPCHPLPPYINPGCTMGPRMTDVCANNLRGSLADKRS